MTVRATKKRTAWEELCALPEHLVGEIIDGALVVSPRPDAAHSYAKTALVSTLTTVLKPGSWWVFLDPELHVEGDVIAPDLAGWRDLPVFKGNAAEFACTPEWACEVVSSETQRVDRVLKLPRYAEAGVRDVWMLEPDSRTLWTYHRRASSWLLGPVYVGCDKVRARPFDAVEWDLGLLWLPEKRSAKRSTRVSKTKRH